MANKRILLVEDDPNFGTVLKDYLELNDYDVHHAKDGLDGLIAFKNDDFDICILDVMMPKKDGFSLAKDIRAVNQDVPLIFLTAKSMKEDVLKGYQVGADDYLTINGNEFKWNSLDPGKQAKIGARYDQSIDYMIANFPVNNESGQESIADSLFDSL